MARWIGRKKSGVTRAEAGAESHTRPYEAVAHLIGCARGEPKDLSERTGEKLRKLLRPRIPPRGKR